MHEVGIMQSVFDIAFKWAEKNREENNLESRLVRISCVSLRVGALSGVVPDALGFAFEALKPGTPAETARLEVEFVPLLLYCPDCQQEFTTDGYSYLCPDCGRFDTEIRKGRELEITGIELCVEDGTEGVSEGVDNGADAGAVDGRDR